MHVLRLEEDSVGGGCRRLNEVLSSPLVSFSADSDLEPDVALDEQRRLNANGSIRVDESADDFDSIKTTRNPIRWQEARPGDVDNCSAQHVTRFRRKNQR